MLDLLTGAIAGSQNHWIYPEFRDREGEDVPRLCFRPASVEEYLAWLECNRIVAKREEKRANALAGQVQTRLKELTVRVSGVGTAGEKVYMRVAPDSLTEEEIEEALALKKAREEGGEKEEEEASERENVDVDAMDREALLLRAADAIVETEATVSEDGKWEMFYLRGDIHEPVPEISDYEHHLQLALACVTRVDNLILGGTLADWNDEEAMRKVTGWENPRREILLRLAKNMGALNAIVDLAVACVSGLSEDEKKASEPSSSASSLTSAPLT